MVCIEESVSSCALGKAMRIERVRSKAWRRCWGEEDNNMCDVDWKGLSWEEGWGGHRVAGDR